MRVPCDTIDKSAGSVKWDLGRSAYAKRAVLRLIIIGGVLTLQKVWSASSAANAYVSVFSSVYGVERIVPIGMDFYVTTRTVGAPAFRAAISVSAQWPYYLVWPADGTMYLGIKDRGAYKVKDESGNEDTFSGLVHVLKLDIEQDEVNVCWKSTRCT